MANPASLTRLTPASDQLFRWFRAYARRYVARRFHAVRIARTGDFPQLAPGPVIVMLNHASWWDPLIGFVLSELAPAGRRHAAPIENLGLTQYPFLARLGFYGVETGTATGARRFLNDSLQILENPDAMLWITPQGRFVDARIRPVVLRPGLGMLVHKCPAVTIVPLAVEYAFWNDRCPEALACFGLPIEASRKSHQSPSEWTTRLGRALEETQDRLAVAAQSRDPAAFTTLLSGTSGVGGIYDAWRRLKSLVTGRRFQPEHQVLDSKQRETTDGTNQDQAHLLRTSRS